MGGFSDIITGEDGDGLAIDHPKDGFLRLDIASPDSPSTFEESGKRLKFGPAAAKQLRTRLDQYLLWMDRNDGIERKRFAYEIAIREYALLPDAKRKDGSDVHLSRARTAYEQAVIDVTREEGKARQPTTPSLVRPAMTGDFVKDIRHGLTPKELEAVAKLSATAPGEASPEEEAKAHVAEMEKWHASSKGQKAAEELKALVTKSEAPRPLKAPAVEASSNHPGKPKEKP